MSNCDAVPDSRNRGVSARLLRERFRPELPEERLVGPDARADPERRTSRAVRAAQERVPALVQLDLAADRRHADDLLHLLEVTLRYVELHAVELPDGMGEG